ncbi:MAG: fatty acid desaturase [Limnothrix sp.]
MSISEVSSSNVEPTAASFEHVATQKIAPNKLLSAKELSTLNKRSNLKGIVRLGGHLLVMGVSGYLWATYGFIALPALVIYGFSFAAMFSTMHECIHRTAFANNRLNDVVGWFAGLFSFYNSTFYRRYHKWHHRFTQIPDQDPELGDRLPTNVWEYLVVLSGVTWWWGKIQGHLSIAAGQVEDYPFLSATAQKEVIRSTRLQLLVYAGAIAISFTVGKPLFLLYWVLPLAIGQPILRAILLAEHTGCSSDGHSLTNTRTTLTNPFVRFLIWEMSFHCEHHLYASIPFHALGNAHDLVGQHFTNNTSGYLSFHRSFVGQLIASEKAAA